MSVSIENKLAQIGVSKNLRAEYKTSESERTVYLSNGTEFQIYIKNPYQNHLGIKIYVNDKYVGNMLVLRPGQSVWLERFLDNDSKFLFSTYEVENTAEMHYAINKNGRIKLQFYHEKERSYNCYPSIAINSSGNTYGDGTYLTSTLYSTTLNDATLKGCVADISTSCLDLCEVSGNVATNSATFSASANANTRSAKIDRQTLEPSSLETGRIEKGSRSDQKFEYSDINFDSWSFKTEDILILPESRKPVNGEETRKRYCTNCGKKASPKDKFCSACGHKL